MSPLDDQRISTIPGSEPLIKSQSRDPQPSNVANRMSTRVIMAKLMNLNLQEQLATLPQRALTVLHETIHLLIAIFDPYFQRIGAITGLTRFTSARYKPDIVKVINRLFVSGIIVLLVLWMSYSHYEAVVTDTEIPILGTKEQDVALIFPPIGNSFFPQVTSYNQHPKFRPRTPLLIPFTRNNALMQQTVLSYIAAGWPRSDIIIVDNSGTMDANNKHLLSKTNPFYLDYELYRARYGVTIIQTPTLLNFAQLQNFMLRVALSRDWPYFFWSHMDVAVLSAEEVKPYKSFYHRVLDVLDASGVDQWAIKSRKSEDTQDNQEPVHNRRAVFANFMDREAKPDQKIQAKKRSTEDDKIKKRSLETDRPRWAVKLFAYDYLTMVNVDAWRDIGQWDVFIPYYNTDCDAYERIKYAGYGTENVQVGHVFDVAESIEDPENRFFPSPNQRNRNKWGIGPQGEEPEGGALNSWRYQWLKAELDEMVDRKTSNPDGRNSWQQSAKDERGSPDSKGRPSRGKMEPWTYDPKSFQTAWWGMADSGREMYIKKWGTMDCDLHQAGKTLDDMFLQEYVPQESEVWNVRMRAQEHYLSVLHDGPIR